MSLPSLRGLRDRNGYLYAEARRQFVHELGLCTCDGRGACGELERLPSEAAVRDAYRRILMGTHPDKQQQQQQQQQRHSDGATVDPESARQSAALRPSTDVACGGGVENGGVDNAGGTPPARNYELLSMCKRELIADMRRHALHGERVSTPPASPGRTTLGAPTTSGPGFAGGGEAGLRRLCMWPNEARGQISVPLGVLYNGGTMRHTVLVTLPVHTGAGGGSGGGSGVRPSNLRPYECFALTLDVPIERGLLANGHVSLLVCVADCHLAPEGGCVPRGCHVAPLDTSTADEHYLLSATRPCVDVRLHGFAAVASAATTAAATAAYGSAASATTCAASSTPPAEEAPFGGGADDDEPRLVRTQHCSYCYIVPVRLLVVDEPVKRFAVVGGSGAGTAGNGADPGSDGARLESQPGHYEFTRAAAPPEMFALRAFIDDAERERDARRWVAHYTQRAALHCRLAVHLADAIANVPQRIVHPNGVDVVEVRVAEPHCMLDTRRITIERYGMPLYMDAVCGLHGRLRDLCEPAFGDMLVEFIVCKPNFVAWPSATERLAVAAALRSYSHYTKSFRVAADAPQQHTASARTAAAPHHIAGVSVLSGRLVPPSEGPAGGAAATTSDALAAAAASGNCAMGGATVVAATHRRGGTDNESACPSADAIEKDKSAVADSGTSQSTIHSAAAAAGAATVAASAAATTTATTTNAATNGAGDIDHRVETGHCAKKRRTAGDTCHESAFVADRPVRRRKVPTRYSP